VRLLSARLSDGRGPRPVDRRGRGLAVEARVGPRLEAHAAALAPVLGERHEEELAPLVLALDLRAGRGGSEGGGEEGEPASYLSVVRKPWTTTFGPLPSIVVAKQTGVPDLMIAFGMTAAVLP